MDYKLEEASETLVYLIANWENEIVEFKSATGQYSEDKIGQYFSAISNEANLKNQQYGWLILGVSEDSQRRIVGTNFKKGSPSLLEKFKYSLSQHLTDGITFMEIVELFPDKNDPEKRVLMFKIPAATAGIPTAWKNDYFARSGESLVRLSQNKIDIIRGQFRRDWSSQIIPYSSIADLDEDAIAFARKKYKDKIRKQYICEDVDKMTDFEFLSKLRLIKGDHLTNAALLLLGKEERDILFDGLPKIMWRHYSENGDYIESIIYSIPFITAVDKAINKIRIFDVRYMVSDDTQFPEYNDSYDDWLLHELVNNAVAHSNYQLGGRIYR